MSQGLARCRALVRIPWLREVLTWNLLLVLRRKA